LDPAGSNLVKKPLSGNSVMKNVGTESQLQDDCKAPGVTGRLPNVIPARYAEPETSTAIVVGVVRASVKYVE